MNASAPNMKSPNGIPCIRPNNPLLQMIQSQSIGPGADFHIFEHYVSTSSAHGRGLDSGESRVPVSPEEDPWGRKRQRKQLVLKRVCFYEDEHKHNHQFISFHRSTNRNCWTSRPSESNSEAILYLSVLLQNNAIT